MFYVRDNIGLYIKHRSPVKGIESENMQHVALPSDKLNEGETNIIGSVLGMRGEYTYERKVTPVFWMNLITKIAPYEVKMVDDDEVGEILYPVERLLIPLLNYNLGRTIIFSCLWSQPAPHIANG